MRWCWVLVLLAACVEPARNAESCQVMGELQPSEPAPELDVVIAISDSPATAALHDRIVAGIGQLAEWIAPHSLHVAVVAADPGDVGDYLVELQVPWFLCGRTYCDTRNFDGALADAIAARASSPTGVPNAPVLARVEHALVNDDSGFVTPGGDLAVIVISADDDGSPGTLDGYELSLQAFLPPEHTVFVTITGDSTPRLDELGWMAHATIDSPDWSSALSWLGHGDMLLTPECLDAAADPDRCVVEEDDALVPPCLMDSPDRPDPGTPLPCYRFTANPACDGVLEPIIERAHYGGDAKITCACQ